MTSEHRGPAIRGAYAAWVLLAAASVLGAPVEARAGGWTQPAGATYAKLWTRSIVGTLAYGHGGARETIRGLPRYQDHQLNLYVEYGLLDTLTLVMRSTPFGVASIGGETQPYVGARGAGLRQALLRGAWPLALEVSYAWTAPYGNEVLFEDERPTTASPTALRVIRTQPTFSGHQLGGELQLGHALPRGRWVSMALGVRWFSHPDVTPALVGLFQLGRQWRPALSYEAHLTLYDPLAADIVVTNPLGAGQTRYVGLGASLTWWVHPQVGLHAGVDGVITASSNAATPSLMVGVELRRQRRRGRGE